MWENQQRHVATIAASFPFWGASDWVVPTCWQTLAAGTASQGNLAPKTLAWDLLHAADQPSLSSRTEGHLSLIPHLRHHLSGHSCASLPSTALIHLTPLLLRQRLQPLLNSELSFLFELFHPTLAQVHVNSVRSRLLPGHLVLAEQVRYHSREQTSPQS